MPALQVKILIASASASTPDPLVGEEGLQTDMDMTIGADASSLEAVAATVTPHISKPHDYVNHMFMRPKVLIKFQV
jgi:hypothetical protein